MRPLSAALLAAQRRPTGQEVHMRLQVRDKLLRVHWLGSSGARPGGAASAVCRCAATGHLVVAVLDAAGVIRVRIVTNPQDGIDPTGEDAYGWGKYPAAYTTVLTGALSWPHGDVAIGAGSASGLRIFYVAGDGSELRCVASADGGSTWGADGPAIKALTGGDATLDYRLASSHADHVWWCYSRSGSRYVHYRTYGSGTWGSEKTLMPLAETGGEFGQCHGLSAAWWPEQECWAVAAAFQDADGSNGRIVTARFDPTAESGHETTHVQRIAPPGQAPVGVAPHYPALLRVSEGAGGGTATTQGWLLSFIDAPAQAAAGARGVCLRSRDCDHWSYRLPLAFDTTYGARINWVEHESDGEAALYGYQCNEACRATAWAAGRADMECTVEHEDILAWHSEETPDGSHLTIDLDNRDGQFDGAGLTGNPAESIRPLASLTIETGLTLADGTVEHAAGRTFQLWSAARVCEPGRDVLRLEGYDGFELFRRWRPDATYVFENRTLGWVIAELAARVGGFAVAFDRSAAWDTALSYLSVAGEKTDWSGRHHIRAAGRWVPLGDPAVAFDERNDGYTLLQRLLGLVGGVARWGAPEDAEALYCLVPYEQGAGPASDHIYGDGEILRGCYADRFAWPTRVRATGDADAAYETNDVPLTLTAGIELFSPLHSAQWATAEQCQAAAAAALDDALARSKGGWFETRPNLGLELFDVVTFTDHMAGGGGYHEVKRRVNTLRTTYDPARGIWRQVVGLEGV